jgi:hypothetical protein
VFVYAFGVDGRLVETSSVILELINVNTISKGGSLSLIADRDNKIIILMIVVVTTSNWQCYKCINITRIDYYDVLIVYSYRQLWQWRHRELSLRRRLHSPPLDDRPTIPW